jgi:hypothetical protein
MNLHPIIQESRLPQETKEIHPTSIGGGIQQ